MTVRAGERGRLLNVTCLCEAYGTGVCGVDKLKCRKREW